MTVEVGDYFRRIRPSTTLIIEPHALDALDIDELDYELLKRRDLGLVYVQAGEARRFSVTRDGYYRVQVYDETFTLDIAEIIMDAGWRIHDEVSPHAEF